MLASLPAPSTALMRRSSIPRWQARDMVLTTEHPTAGTAAHGRVTDQALRLHDNRPAPAADARGAHRRSAPASSGTRPTTSRRCARRASSGERRRPWTPAHWRLRCTHRMTWRMSDLAAELRAAMAGDVRDDAYTRHLFSTRREHVQHRAARGRVPARCGRCRCSCRRLRAAPSPDAAARRGHQPGRSDGGAGGDHRHLASHGRDRRAGPGARTARVQPGVVQDDLNRAARDARAALRPGYVDEQPGDDRRDDRQQLGRQRLGGVRHDHRSRRGARGGAERRQHGHIRAGRRRRGDAQGCSRHASRVGSTHACRRSSRSIAPRSRRGFRSTGAVPAAIDSTASPATRRSTWPASWSGPRERW